MAGLYEGGNELPGSLKAISWPPNFVVGREVRIQSLMLAGKEIQSLGRAIVKKDEYEEMRWDGIVSIVSWRERVFRLWWEESKTKVLTNDAEGQMIVNNANIEFVTQYIYLGQTISFQNSMDKEIDRRIASAWRKFWSLSFILMDKSQKLQNKGQIFNSCIAPVLLYGAQSWSLTKKQALKLGRCQRRMERKILGISLKDRIRNEEVRRRSGVEDVVTLANRMKWRWGGHVVRMQPTRHGDTVGSKNWLEKPWTTEDQMGDEFKLQLGGLWTRIGRQRTRWRDAVNQC
ncbi:hypothetical protein ANN_15618 [Periplaneta americana]|uniref:Uncharacterized protein n=1 Tax=Periplaneta americana TaxID=6978 RepID=A0ABQ8SGU7_PERAM|nr:hypothetical protein ANN_15618 [Periplaneta americana]